MTGPLPHTNWSASVVAYAKHIGDTKRRMRDWMRLGIEERVQHYAVLAWKLKKRWERELKRRGRVCKR
ncbi:hypothetical protein R5W23_000855 [Gemmata sp. JC673]|uniref:Uncharacterized protein n=1 Tax=Gemmata algarum TaxID=2975278 RepID=A0ABU5EWX6_9BACT|nr:hypothetical protein [Gemmata algarum]MDY3558134.1 hypothetical protein [Gemmata algarum]